MTAYNVTVVFYKTNVKKHKIEASSFNRTVMLSLFHCTVSMNSPKVDTRSRESIPFFPPQKIHLTELSIGECNTILSAYTL